VIRSLHHKNGSLLIGTQASEIFELNMSNLNKIECVCKGHAEGELWALAVSPADSNVFATASDDYTVRIWNIKDNSLNKITELEHRIRSCAFNVDGQSLACGLSDGTLVVLKTQLVYLFFCFFLRGGRGIEL
jgi:WD40 repeat protein